MNTTENTTTGGWATADNPATLTISSDCVCRYCPKCECGVWATDDERCDECLTELQFSDCWNCAEGLAELFAEMLTAWLDRNNNPAELRINGTGMGWRSRSGHLDVAADWESVWDGLTFEGDWTLHLTLAGDRLTVRRTSHDEPTGAHFELAARAAE